MTVSSNVRSPSLLDAIIPVVILIGLLAAGVWLFEDNSSYGPNQISLILAAGIVCIIGIKNGYRWKELEKAMVNGISLSMGAIFILLAVGSLIGTWLLSGTVPTLIYYGLKILSPDWFYAASCLMCAVVAMSIGSSWTTAATIGVALMGIAAGLDLSAPVTAGAVISGAYFGDKLSPLSETTNLAPSVAGTDLFTHIRNMLWTTIPSFTIALVIFTFIGLSGSSVADDRTVEELSTLLTANFDISILNLIPLVILLTMAIRKVPAFPAILIGALIGGLWAVLFQGELIAKLAGSSAASSVDYIKVIWTAFFDGVTVVTGNEKMDDLLSGGGMSSMLNTTWLIMSALMFGAVMEKTQLLNVFVMAILKLAKSTGALIASTICTCIGVNLMAADQYMSIVMPGRMFKEEFERRGLDGVNLSRTLEDGGTITSPLIPWNTCGAFMAGVLAVPTGDYFMYCFFNLINPVIAIAFAFMGVRILQAKPAEQQAQTA